MFKFPDRFFELSRINHINVLSANTVVSHLKRMIIGSVRFSSNFHIVIGRAARQAELQRFSGGSNGSKQRGCPLEPKLRLGDP